MPKTKAPGDVEIFYETSGEGPPLLLVSGTGHDHTFWSGQLPLFEQEFRCLVFDNRGVGLSNAPPPGYALKNMADDAAAVLDAAGVDRAHVIGFSMGGAYLPGALPESSRTCDQPRAPSHLVQKLCAPGEFSAHPEALSRSG